MATVICFYLMAIMLVTSALAVVFAPKMFFAVVSFFSVIFFSSLLYCFLNAKYLATFQFILCGIFLVGYILLLLKKIDKLDLSLKLVSKSKMIISSFFVFFFGFLITLFFIFEENHLLGRLFNFICQTSSDIVSFLQNIFPLSLVVIMLFVTAIVVRVLLLSSTGYFVSNIQIKNQETFDGENNV